MVGMESLSVFTVISTLAVVLLLLTDVNAQKSVELDYKTLKQVHVMVRNGEHYPDVYSIARNPKYERSNEQFPRGELTEDGRATMYERGATLRQMYGDFLGRPALAPYLVSALGVHSPNTRRSRESALLMMEGLRATSKRHVVRRNWTDSELESVNEEEFTYQATKYYTNCSSFEVLQNKRLYKHLGPKMKAEYKDLWDALNANTGVELKLNKLGDLYALYDIYASEESSEMTHPSWLTEDLYLKFQKLMEEYVEISFSTRALKSMAGGMGLQGFFDIIDSKVEGTLPACNTRMFLFSGNDATVAPYFAAFAGKEGFRRVHDERVVKSFFPDNGGMIAIELHEVKNNPKDYYLKMYYSHHLTSPVYELVKPDCGQPCRASKLRNILKGIASTPDMVDQLCSAIPSQQQQKPRQGGQKPANPNAE